MTRFFPASKSAISIAIKKWAVAIVVDSLSGITDAKHAKLVFNSVFRHIEVDKNYERSDIIWASKFLEYVAGAIVTDYENTVLDELRKIL